jgi:hypothetical protein
MCRYAGQLAALISIFDSFVQHLCRYTAHLAAILAAYQ